MYRAFEYQRGGKGEVFLRLLGNGNKVGLSFLVQFFFLFLTRLSDLIKLVTMWWRSTTTQKDCFSGIAETKVLLLFFAAVGIVVTFQC